MSIIEKRSVHTDALQTLGSTIGSSEKRDAIHLAVEPVIARHDLKPGQDVGLFPGGAAGQSSNPVGIVDPFLKHGPRKGERFWLIVYPRQITSLRHVWSHPAFVELVDESRDPQLSSESEDWIRDFAGKIYYDYGDGDDEGPTLTYEQVMVAAKKWLEREDDYCLRRDIDYDFMARNIPLFWENYTRVTGEIVADHKRESFFRCAC